MYGDFVAAKLDERDEKFRPVHTLGDIIEGRVTARGREGSIGELRAMFG